MRHLARLPLILLLAATGCARPVAPSRPPPQVIGCGTYLLFFDSKASTLTTRATEIVAEFVQASRRAGVVRVAVEAHADRAGSDAANLRISRHRAEAVAEELVRLGVPRETIIVAPYGETRPLVPTPDGKAEPQNRRVEIIAR